MEVFKQDQYAIVQDLLQRQDDALVQIDELNEAVEAAIDELGALRASELEQLEQEGEDQTLEGQTLYDSPAVTEIEEIETLPIGSQEELASGEQHVDESAESESSKAA